jgi:hypothetical protein
MSNSWQETIQTLVIMAGILGCMSAFLWVFFQIFKDADKQYRDRSDPEENA